MTNSSLTAAPLNPPYKDKQERITGTPSKKPKDQKMDALLLLFFGGAIGMPLLSLGTAYLFIWGVLSTLSWLWIVALSFWGGLILVLGLWFLPLAILGPNYRLQDVIPLSMGAYAAIFAISAGLFALIWGLVIANSFIWLVGAISLGIGLVLAILALFFIRNI